MMQTNDAPSSDPIELRRERTFGQVISDTLSVLGAHLGTFLPALFVVVAVPLLVLIGALTVVGPFVGGMIAGLVALPLFWTMLAATFAYFLLYEDGFFARGERLNPGVLWSATKPLILPIIWVQLAIGVLAFAPFAIVGYLAAEQESWALFAGLAIVGLPLLFVFLPAIVMATPAAVMEGGNPIESLRRGVALTKEHWGQTFGVYFVASILAAVFGLPFSMSASFVMLFVEGTVGAAVFGVLTALGYVGYTVLFGALLVQYFNLVERKEGHQLEARVEEIGMDDDEEPLF